jgi:hypothetical protein
MKIPCFPARSFDLFRKSVLEDRYQSPPYKPCNTEIRPSHNTRYLPPKARRKEGTEASPNAEISLVFPLDWGIFRRRSTFFDQNHAYFHFLSQNL